MSRSACSAFIFLSLVANKYLTVKVSKQSDFGVLKVYKISFQKLCGVRQNNIQKKTDLGDSGCLHWSTDNNEEQ